MTVLTAAQRWQYAEGWLATRGLDMHTLGETILRHVPLDVDVLMLTSSPVHGLANATSDIDTICVTADAVPGDRLALKIFADGHHLEAMPYRHDEVDAAFAALDDVVDGDPASVAAGLAGWNDRHLIRRKFVERLVNGLALDGTMPYDDRRSAVARGWSISALDAALRAVVHATLAERAGESYGRLGYALNALLDLMDSVLSAEGDVNTGRKWILLRWERRLAAGPPTDGVLAVEAIRAAVKSVCAGPAASSVAGELWAAGAAVAAGLGLPAPCPSLAVRSDVVECGFLPGVPLWLRGGTLTLGAADDVPAPDPGEAALCGLGADTARQWLRRARSGLADVEVWPAGDSG